MVNPKLVRRCEFCEEEVEDYPQHLRSHHKMAGTGEASKDSQAQVKCMFCLEQMSETDMFAHVFYGHNISGMFFSSAGGGEGGEKDLTPSKTVSVQTEDDPDTSSERFEPILSTSPSADLEIIDQSEISSNNDKEQMDTSEESPDELHDQEEETEEETEKLANPGCDLIYLDDDESDFEIEDDGPSPQLEIIFENSPAKYGDDSEVTLIETKNSNIPSKIQPSSVPIVDTPEPQVTLINIAKRKDPDVVSPSPVKKVRFSDVTNYYPIKKRGKLKRRTRKLVPLILGANTSLKYLKYWGTTNKPD